MAQPNRRTIGYACAIVLVARAAMPSTAAADAFALQFQPGVAALDMQGAAGETNGATLTRLLTALSLRAEGASFEIILTGARPKSCRDDSACAQLLFNRTRVVNAALRERDSAATGRGVQDTLTRYAEDMKQPPMLPVAPPGTDPGRPAEILYVRTERSRPFVADPACPLVVHVSDPALPPGLDGRRVEIQIVSPRTVTVTAASVIRVSPMNHEGRRVAIGFESGDQMARGAIGQPVAIASLYGGQWERLHLVAADKADNAMLRALETLPTTPKGAPDVIALLGGPHRGFDPDARRPAATGPALPSPDVVTCAVTVNVRIPAVR